MLKLKKYCQVEKRVRFQCSSCCPRLCESHSLISEVGLEMLSARKASVIDCLASYRLKFDPLFPSLEKRQPSGPSFFGIRPTSGASNDRRTPVFPSFTLIHPSKAIPSFAQEKKTPPSRQHSPKPCPLPLPIPNHPLIRPWPRCTRRTFSERRSV